MINPFKNFSKKKIGGLLLIFVIIVAFGFGGFGGGFSTGNQNNIAKINNTNISTQDFMDYLNESLTSAINEAKINVEDDDQKIKPLNNSILKPSLDEIENKKYTCLENTWDLYGELSAKMDEETQAIFHIKTHYEKLFSAKGFTIKYCKFQIN